MFNYYCVWLETLPMWIETTICSVGCWVKYTREFIVRASSEDEAKTAAEEYNPSYRATSVTHLAGEFGSIACGLIAQSKEPLFVHR